MADWSSWSRRWWAGWEWEATSDGPWAGQQWQSGTGSQSSQGADQPTIAHQAQNLSQQLPSQWMLDLHGKRVRIEANINEVAKTWSAEKVEGFWP